MDGRIDQPSPFSSDLLLVTKSGTERTSLSKMYRLKIVTRPVIGRVGGLIRHFLFSFFLL